MNTDRDSEIAERAYHIWEREGRPDGKALDHWLQAEATVRADERGPEIPAQAARQKRPVRRK